MFESCFNTIVAYDAYDDYYTNITWTNGDVAYDLH